MWIKRFNPRLLEMHRRPLCIINRLHISLHSYLNSTCIEYCKPIKFVNRDVQFLQAWLVRINYNYGKHVNKHEYTWSNISWFAWGSKDGTASAECDLMWCPARPAVCWQRTLFFFRLMCLCEALQSLAGKSIKVLWSSGTLHQLLMLEPLKTNSARLCGHHDSTFR